MSAETKSIAVIGAGWAGLAAALELCRHNYKVSVFESSPQTGGRARSIEWNGITLDNGQHLMIGAYQQMLSLLDLLEADVQALFKRLPHQMLMLDAKTGSRVFDLQLPRLPAPLHLLGGVLKTPYLSFVEKLQVLIRFNRLLNTPLKQDLSVDKWLASANLPQKYIKNVLEPVCLAALTTHPWQASAKAFQSVLQQTFNAPAEHTDLLIPATDLGQTIPALAENFILNHGGQIHTRSKVKRLYIENSQITSLYVNEQKQSFDHYILATPPSTTLKLLEDVELARNTCEQLQSLAYEPVTTLYLAFSQPVKLPALMTGFINGITEWAFERSVSGQNSILAIVISAQGEHLNMSHEQLKEQVLNELKQAIPELPQPQSSKLITEKHATFQCHPDVDQYRPGIKTRLSNLNLCGDYVYIEENNQPGLPSTLEGALRSGVKCAQTIIKQLNN